MRLSILNEYYWLSVHRRSWVERRKVPCPAVISAVDFPHLAVDTKFGLPSFLVEGAPSTHAVQFYERDTFLFETVGQFLSAGLAANDRIYVVASKPHTQAFLERVDPIDLQRARDERRITILDARATLAKFMVGDMPDPRRFHDLVAELTAGNGRDEPSPRVRAYGEMVDVLASEGNIRAAIRLEHLWHEVLQEQPFLLLCAYLMGNFYRQTDGERLTELCAAHSHVIPTESFVSLTDPNDRLRELLLLQHKGKLLKREVEQRKNLEQALGEALCDLGKVEGELLGWVQREQNARQHALSSDAFQERFLSILGHDLRNPLNTILTTVRMMALRKELAPESQTRLERVVASSVRMQRMIEQLLGVAQARLPDGIAVRPDAAQPMAPIVGKIVDEVRAANPSRAFEFEARPCLANVDIERIEQTVWSLLMYLAAHADSESPIRVEVGPRASNVVIRFETRGFYIAPASLTKLFDSFDLESAPEVGMEGLTLGLFVAKRIVVAHHGIVAASSSVETGTVLEAILPLA